MSVTVRRGEFMVTLEGEGKPEGVEEQPEEEIAAQNRVPISSDPRMFDTHFVQLTKRQQKGQAKYRCRTCLHEFTCCGKRRRLQHILGDDFLIGKSKNVLNCKAPYQPLKDALLQVHRQQLSLKRNQETMYRAEPNTSTNPREAGITSENDDDFRELLTDISFSTDFEGPENNFMIMPGGSSSSAGSTSGDEGLEPISKRFKGDYMSVSNAGSTDSMDVVSPTSMRSLYPDHVDEHNKRVMLNRAIINFFFLYRIPLTAVETNDFRAMMDAILNYQHDSSSKE